MPLYSYRCKDVDCGHGFEDIVSFDTPNPSCPECGAETEKEMAPSALHFKGTGFYVTDYPKG